MGIFIAYPKQAAVDHTAIAEVARRKGLSQKLSFSNDHYTIDFFPKKLIAQPQYAIEGDKAFFVGGTIIHKGSNAEETIARLKQDIFSSSFDPQNYRGTYIIAALLADGLHFYLEPSLNLNLFYSPDKGIFSNSFLLAAYALDKLSLDMDAHVEILATGGIIGEETQVNELKRVTRKLPQISRVHFHLPEIKGQDQDAPRNFEDSVADQLRELENYFADTAAFLDQHGVDSGITGGHDSRLVMGLVLKHNHQYQFHSHWRKTKDRELLAAEAVCKAAGLSTKIVQLSHPLDKTEEQLEDTIQESFYFYDGQNRMHCYWTEDYLRRDYREQVLGDAYRIGVSGIGGEQYRNDEHMNLPSWDFDHFVRYHLLRHKSGEVFKDAETEARFIETFKKKALAALGLPAHTKSINRYLLKRYYNEVFNPSLRNVRLNAENQLSYYLNPFTEYQVASHAYRAVPQLGLSYAFEQRMISRLNPTIAAAVSDYGYDFVAGEPMKHKLKFLVKELMPASMYANSVEKRFASRADQLKAYTDKFPFIKELLAKVNRLDLPLDIEKIKKRPDLAPLLVNTGYFIRTLEKDNKLK